MIIAAIQEAPEEEEEEETTSASISYTVALDSVQNLFNYLEQNCAICCGTWIDPTQTFKILIQGN